MLKKLAAAGAALQLAVSCAPSSNMNYGASMPRHDIPPSTVLREDYRANANSLARARRAGDTQTVRQLAYEQAEIRKQLGQASRKESYERRIDQTRSNTTYQIEGLPGVLLNDGVRTLSNEARRGVRQLGYELRYPTR